MTQENKMNDEALKACKVCGKIPHMHKYSNPRPSINMWGDEIKTKPFVSIQCDRHDGVLANVHAYGENIQEAISKGLEQWNRYNAQSPTPSVSGEVVEWQPIETAPMDGTRVLVRNGSEGGYYTEPFDIGVAEWSCCFGKKQWGSVACCDVSYYKPTHWMPLPKPPLVIVEGE
jgi:hypothetical protein